ncbi:MAG: hypothetical protein Q4P20_03615 [Eubacteriales bacterium]|nr:hypothetical protein [Eubacteriales bacterium]
MKKGFAFLKRSTRLLLLLGTAVFLSSCNANSEALSDDGGYEPPGYVCVKQNNADGSYLTFAYNRDGECVKSTCFSVDDTLMGWTEYTFGDSGWKTEQTEYNAEGEIKTRSVMEYDGGCMTKLTCFDGENEQQYQQTYDYDENSYCIKETYISDNLSYWYDIERDENGREIKRTMRTDDNDQTTTVEFSYDAEDQLIKTTTYEDSAIRGWDEYTYDAAGNQLSCTAYTVDGQANGAWEYSYDKDGNLIQAAFNGTGSAELLSTYEYMTFGDYLKQQS